jgi:hypothetical protein
LKMRPRAWLIFLTRHPRLRLASWPPQKTEPESDAKVLSIHVHTSFGLWLCTTKNVAVAIVVSLDQQQQYCSQSSLKYLRDH